MNSSFEQGENVASGDEGLGVRDWRYSGDAVETLEK